MAKRTAARAKRAREVRHTRRTRRANRRGARDYPNLEAALEAASSRFGATHVIRSGNQAIIFSPTSRGYEKRVLFAEKGFVHWPKQAEIVQSVPPHAQLLLDVIETGFDPDAPPRAVPMLTRRAAEETPRGEVDEVAVDELLIYAENEGPLYPKRKAIASNLKRKMEKGAYKPELAAKAWLYFIDDAARRYEVEFGSGKFGTTFNKATREAAARQWEERERGRIQRGELAAEDNKSRQHVTREMARKIGDELGVRWSSVDIEQFRRGIEVEQEHTSDLRAAARIALDHLREDKRYYTKLTKAGLETREGFFDPEFVILVKYGPAGPEQPEPPGAIEIVRRVRGERNAIEEVKLYRSGASGSGNYYWYQRADAPLPHGARDMGAIREVVERAHEGRRYDHEEWLEFECEPAEPTPELKALAKQFREGVIQFTDSWARTWSVDLGNLKPHALTWNAYASLIGHGVGLWEGDGDTGLSGEDEKKLDKALKRSRKLQELAWKISDECSMLSEDAGGREAHEQPDDEPPITERDPGPELAPRLQPGYAFFTPGKAGKDSWKRIRNDDWEHYLVSEDDAEKAEYLGVRDIDGIPHDIFEFYPQGAVTMGRRFKPQRIFIAQVQTMTRGRRAGHEAGEALGKYTTKQSTTSAVKDDVLLDGVTIGFVSGPYLKKRGGAHFYEWGLYGASATVAPPFGLSGTFGETRSRKAALNALVRADKARRARSAGADTPEREAYEEAIDPVAIAWVERFEADLKTDDVIEARWTWGHDAHSAPARVTKLSKKSLRASLLEPYSYGERGGTLPKGHSLVLPRYGAPGWSANNGAFPPRGARVAQENPIPADDAVPWVKISRDPDRYMQAVKEARRLGPIDNPRKVYELLGEAMLKEDQEVLCVILLDVRQQCRGVAEVHRGGRSRVATDVADVMRVVLQSGAESFVMTHNHPSGTCSPSGADKDLTKAVARAAKPFDGSVAFVDHVVLGAGEYYSFAEKKVTRVKG